MGTPFIAQKASHSTAQAGGRSRALPIRPNWMEQMPCKMASGLKAPLRPCPGHVREVEAAIPEAVHEVVPAEREHRQGPKGSEGD